MSLRFAAFLAACALGLAACSGGGGAVPTTNGNIAQLPPTPTPLPGGAITPTPRPGSTPSSTPAPGKTPTPHPGGTPTPSPRPGGTPTPTPHPGGTPTPSPRPTGTPTASPTSAPTPTPLVVGPGRPYLTLASALAAAHDGDTIDVVSGTYTNDFSNVDHRVTIQGVGGMVKMVATEPLPNSKAFLVVNDDLTIRNFEFSGATTPNGNNGAGIRGQSGALVIQYCYFHDNQDGILVDSTVAGVNIDRSEFAHNGAGDGKSHNMYINAVPSFTITNSYSHDAVVGHELKSRAAKTTIVNSVFADGVAGDASYEIDIPNAGVASIQNSQIEKGPHAQNPAAIHYGGETQFSWPTNSMTVTGNTIINNLGSKAYAVLNQSAINKLTVTVQFVANRFYGFAANHVVSGLGNVNSTNVIDPNASDAPPLNTTSPWKSAPIIPIPATHLHRR